MIYVNTIIYGGPISLLKVISKFYHIFFRKDSNCWSWDKLTSDMQVKLELVNTGVENVAKTQKKLIRE